MFVVLMISDSCDVQVYGTFASIDEARTFIKYLKWSPLDKDSYLTIEKIKEVL